jgi:hypothetical protein
MFNDAVNVIVLIAYTTFHTLLPSAVSIASIILRYVVEHLVKPSRWMMNDTIKPRVTEYQDDVTRYLTYMCTILIHNILTLSPQPKVTPMVSLGNEH